MARTNGKARNRGGRRSGPPTRANSSPKRDERLAPRENPTRGRRMPKQLPLSQQRRSDKQDRKRASTERAAENEARAAPRRAAAKAAADAAELVQNKKDARDEAQYITDLYAVLVKDNSISLERAREEIIARTCRAFGEDPADFEADLEAILVAAGLGLEDPVTGAVLY